MTNLAVYTENYYYGGLERFLFDLLKNKNFDFEIIANSGNERIANFAQENNIKFSLININRISISINSKNRFIVLFQKALNAIFNYIMIIPNYLSIKQKFKTVSHRENILIINGGYPAALSCLCAAFAAKRIGFQKIGMSILSCPSSRYKNKIFFFLQNILDSAMHKCVDFYIPNAVIIKKELIEFANFKESQIFPIYTGVDVARLQQKNAVLGCRDIGIIKKENEIWLGMIALLGSTKRQDIVIEAMSLIKQQAPFIKCLFVGDGPNMEFLVKKAKMSGIEDSIFFTGWLECIESVYDFIDICVFASDHEGLPYAISEAMMHRLPIIASSVGGIPEQIKDGIGGLLFDNNAKELADKIMYLANHTEARSSYAEFSFLRVSEYFSIDSMNKQIADLYNKI